MHYSVVIFIISALAVGAFGHKHGKHHEKFRAAITKCKADTEVSNEALAAWKNKEDVDDDKLKCFMACVMKSMGSMSEDGVVDADKIVQRLPKHVPNRDRKVQAIAVCSLEKGNDECDTAFRVATCFRNHRVFGHKGEFRKKIQKCKLETKVDTELLRAERNGEEVNDPQVKCFHACMMKKLNLMNEDGKINPTAMIKRIPENDENRDKKIEIITTCAKKKGEDECETAHRVRKCIRNGFQKFAPATTPAPRVVTSDNE